MCWCNIIMMDGTKLKFSSMVILDITNDLVIFGAICLMWHRMIYICAEDDNHTNHCDDTLPWFLLEQLHMYDSVGYSKVWLKVVQWNSFRIVSFIVADFALNDRKPLIDPTIGDLHQLTSIHIYVSSESSVAAINTSSELLMFLSITLQTVWCLIFSWLPCEFIWLWTYLLCKLYDDVDSCWVPLSGNTCSVDAWTIESSQDFESYALHLPYVWRNYALPHTACTILWPATSVEGIYACYMCMCDYSC